MRAAVAAARNVARRTQQPASQKGFAAAAQNGVASAAVGGRHGPHGPWAVNTRTSGWFRQRVFAPARSHSAAWRLQPVRTRMSGWLWGKVDAFMNEEKTLIGEDAAGNQFWEIPNPVPVLCRARARSRCEPQMQILHTLHGETTCVAPHRDCSLTPLSAVPRSHKCAVMKGTHGCPAQGAVRVLSRRGLTADAEHRAGTRTHGARCHSHRQTWKTLT